MNDLTRARAALKRIQDNNERASYEDGLLGRINPSGPPTFVPRGRAGYKYVRIGTLPPVVARDNIGVPESLNLPVRVKKEIIVPNSGIIHYSIVASLRDESMATVPAPPPGGIPAHTHNALYYLKTEHIDVSAGAADAGKPAVLDAGGKWDASLIDSEDIADTVGAMVTGNTETDIAVTYQDGDNTLDFVVSPTIVGDRINAAANKATPVAADRWPIWDSVDSLLKHLTTTQLITWLTTLFMDLTTAQTVGGNKSFTGQVSISNPNNAPLATERTTTAVTLGLAAQILRATTSGDMIDDFGPQFTFQVTDTGVSDSIIGAIGARRAGADNSGRVVMLPRNAGSVVDAASVWPSGHFALGLGTTAPQGRIHAHDGTMGWLAVSKTGIVGSVVTIVPDATGDVITGVVIYGVARNTTPGAAKVDTALIAPGGTADVVIGADTLRFAVSAGGAVTVIRQAGTATWAIGVTLTWL